jgi:hypothetical protein
VSEGGVSLAALRQHDCIGPGRAGLRAGETFETRKSKEVARECANLPPRLVDAELPVAAAYWCVPPRGIVSRYDVRPGIRHTTDLFKSFKAGNANLAYPFALGMQDALRQRDLETDIDVLVPIPLSPDKARRKEIHRTKLLADELGELLGVPVEETLRLRTPISKRTLQSAGRLGEFEILYRVALVATELLDYDEGDDEDDMPRVALVDLHRSRCTATPTQKDGTLAQARRKRQLAGGFPRWRKWKAARS